MLTISRAFRYLPTSVVRLVRRNSSISSPMASGRSAAPSKRAHAWAGVPSASDGSRPATGMIFTHIFAAVWWPWRSHFGAGSHIRPHSSVGIPDDGLELRRHTQGGADLDPPHRHQHVVFQRPHERRRARPCGVPPIIGRAPWDMWPLEKAHARYPEGGGRMA